MTQDAPAITTNRPRGRPRRDDINPCRIRELKADGKSLRTIARELRLGYGTVRRFLRQVPADAPAVSQKSGATV
jgi:DNA invertase Pin-like site-specific DNA recombinase